jgi:tRNA(fMet)-specific endonuclease VapC
VRYLLDANAISAIVAEPRGPVGRRLAEVGEVNVFTSVIVRAEILFGLKKRASAELTRKVGNVLSRLYIASFDPPADSHYADIRLDLKLRGEPIGANDLWIAAHAMALDAVLVSDNEREFSRVAGLKLENWLRR